MQVKIPAAMQVTRYEAPRFAEINGTEIPLIHPKDPAEKQVQEHWTAHVKVFNLSDPKDAKEHEQVWQDICDKKAVFCEKVGPNWDADGNRYVTLLRWAVKSYKVPQ